MIFPTSCKVCGGSLHHLRPDEEAVCVRPECRFVVSQKNKMPANVYKQFFAARAGHLRERERQTRRQNETIRLAQEQEKTENQEFWQAGMATFPDYPIEQYPLLAVPFNSRKLILLPERRKRAFRDRLNKLISSVTESPQALNNEQLYPNPPPKAAKLLAGACALCKGACCLNGGEHAYLREPTLVRVMQTDPSLRPLHLLDLYLSHLGKKTYESACVYQGEKGCVLPLELRSNICSDYFCPPLNTFKREFEEEENPAGAFVIVRAREHWTFPEGVDNGIAGGFLLSEEGQSLNLPSLSPHQAK